MKFKPHPYQKEAIKMLLKEPSSGLFLDPGEGKTSCVLAALDILKQKGMFKRALVFATLNIIQLETWQDEIRKWGFSKEFDFSVLHGKGRDLKNISEITLINYEGLGWLYENKRVLKNKFDVLVLDESDQVKSFSAQRFKMFKKIIHLFERRYILTGTPAPKNLMDLFSQMYLLDEGERLGRYITHYRNEYFNPCGFKGYQYDLQEGADDKIHKKIKDIIYRPSKDYLKIPKEKYNDIIIKLPKKVMKQYKELEDDYILEVEAGTITAANAGVMSQKLRQVSNGCVYGEGKKPVRIHDYKLEACKSIVSELQGNPVLIGYEFRHELDALLKIFPGAPFIGTTLSNKKPTAKQKNKIKDDWNKGDVPILLGQISSIARGLNIQESGHTIILYGHTHHLGDLIQFIRRLRRQGQKKRVVVHRLICKGTVDEDIILSQNAKKKTQDNLLDAMRKRRLK